MFAAAEAERARLHRDARCIGRAERAAQEVEAIVIAHTGSAKEVAAEDRGRRDDRARGDIEAIVVGRAAAIAACKVGEVEGSADHGEICLNRHPVIEAAAAAARAIQEGHAIPRIGAFQHDRHGRGVDADADMESAAAKTADACYDDGVDRCAALPCNE